MGSAQNLTVAAIQLQSSEDLQANLSAVREQVRRAAAAGAQLAVLPENFAYFGPEQEKANVAEVLGRGGVIQDTLAELCVAHQIVLVAGGMPEQSNDLARPYNTSLVVSAEGRQLARYRKLHLFDVELPDGRTLRESESTTAGNEVVSFELGAFTVGLTICYDLRFGALFQRLSELGANLLTIPAAFTAVTGKAHWHVLLRARAIEFQSWVVAAAQWGKHPQNRQSYGHSMIVDPWGRIVSECEAEPGICVATLDLETVKSIRAQLPCRQHQRDHY
jgi:deaminated glutathione amidase